MSKVYITIGVSGSGKTTAIREIMQDNYLFDSNVVRINSDEKRKASLPKYNPDFNLWSQYKFDKNLEKHIASSNMQELEQALKEDKDIIIDNTHLNINILNRVIDLVQQYTEDYYIINLNVTDNINYYLHRNHNRVDSIPSAGINDQFINACKYDTIMPLESFENNNIAVVDIDGTVAHNDGHRGYFDYSRVIYDLPIHHTIEVVKALYETKRIDYIQFVSGRCSSCYDDTFRWLTQHGFNMNVHRLLMRKQKDNRKDCIIKDEIVRWCLKNKQIKYVFDDRNQMIDYWNDNKYPVFNVGDYRANF